MASIFKRLPVIWSTFIASTAVALATELGLLFSRGVSNQAFTYDATSALDWALHPAWQVAVVSTAVAAWLAVQSAVTDDYRVTIALTSRRRQLVGGLLHAGIPATIALLAGAIVALFLVALQGQLSLPRNLHQLVFTLLMVLTVPLAGSLIGLRFPNVLTPVVIAAVGLFVVTMGVLVDPGWIFQLGGNTAGLIGNSMNLVPFVSRWIVVALVVLAIGFVVLDVTSAVRGRVIAVVSLAAAAVLLAVSPTQPWGIRSGIPSHCGGSDPRVCVWPDEPLDPVQISRDLAPYVSALQRSGVGQLPVFTTAYESSETSNSVSIAGGISHAPPWTVPSDARALMVMQFSQCPDIAARALVGMRTLGAWVLEKRVTGRTPADLTPTQRAWLGSASADAWLRSAVGEIKACSTQGKVPAEFKDVFS